MLIKELNAMIFHQNILPLLLSLFILITIISLCQLSAVYVFAESPPLVRQEIQDGLDDVITIDHCNSTITKHTKSNNRQLHETYNSIDIERVSYFSDGKALNATMWLSLPGLDYNFLPPENFPINFGILIDVNPNQAIGVGGVDYHKEVANYQIPDLPANIETTNSWIEDIHETISYGLHRYLKVSEQNYNYTSVFQQQKEKTGFVIYLPLSLDLSTIALPDKYKITFYILTTSSGCSRIIDFTSWIDIPPPKFVISSSPIILELRTGDAKDLGIVLKSTTGSLHKVGDFINLENNSGIKVIPARGKFRLNGSVFSIEPISFNVQVPENAQTGEYAIPMLVNISTGSTIPSEFVGVKKYNSSIPTESFITTVANLTIKVLEPLTPSERFKEGWDTYGAFISLVGGGFAAGVTSLVFDRLKDRKKKNDDDNNKNTKN
jgi:hypothetical protein